MLMPTMARAIGWPVSLSVTRPRISHMAARRLRGRQRWCDLQQHDPKQRETVDPITVAPPVTWSTAVPEAGLSPSVSVTRRATEARLSMRAGLWSSTR